MVNNEKIIDGSKAEDAATVEVVNVYLSEKLVKTAQNFEKKMVDKTGKKFISKKTVLTINDYAFYFSTNWVHLKDEIYSIGFKVEPNNTIYVLNNTTTKAGTMPYEDVVEYLVKIGGTKSHKDVEIDKNFKLI